MELVRYAYERFNERELHEHWRVWHDDGEYHVSRDDPDSTIHRGKEALQRHYASWLEAYPDLRVEPMEVRASGDKVFAWVHFSGSGAASDLPIEMELAHVLTVREGKIARLAEYMDRTEGLRAAGLSE